MRIFIVRHTRVGVDKGTCYGWSDVPVADSFEEEARETFTHLQQEMKVYGISHFDVCYSSPLSRAMKLAHYCGFQPITDSRLKEYNMGEWEMDNYDNLWKNDPRFHKWTDHYDTMSTPEGESFPEFYQRVTDVFYGIKQQQFENVVIFAHGGVCICGGIYAGLFTVKEAYNDSNMTPYGGIRIIEI